MYTSTLSEQERRAQSDWMREMGFFDNNQRRELNAGFGALRRFELIALCRHCDIEYSDTMSGDLLAQTLDAAWASGKIKRVVEAAIPRKPTLVELQARASRLDIDIRGHNAEMAELMVQEAERAKARPIPAAAAAMADAALGEDAPIRRGPGRPPNRPAA